VGVRLHLKNNPNYFSPPATLSPAFIRLYIQTTLMLRGVNMTCEEVKELQCNYFDQDLIDDARRRIEAHLKTCAACLSDYQSMEHTIAEIRNNDNREEPSNWFTDRLMERLDRQIDTSIDTSLADHRSQLRLSGL
jgi:hypothetical protein